ncbi:AMP-binding protein [Phaeobacter sp.]|uniref:AMP-binding protein n=1 Tax=Phaeobacter sp. TaxID=1902409 RepID=UPI0025EA02B4|nr:AMP-binding protein [Phaeobacter sp.]
MFGKMMHKQLTIGSLIEHAGRFHGSTTVTSVETSGETTHVTWADIESNARKLAAALDRLGIKQGARCGTIAWNNRRHLEIYFGVSGAGYVCHTINPRLTPEQLIYIINHAEDQVLFIDTTFVPAVAKLRPQITGTAHVVVLGERDDTIAQQIDGVLFYTALTPKPEIFRVL